MKPLAKVALGLLASVPVALAGYWVGEAKSGNVWRDRRVEVRVTVLSRSPEPTYLLETFMETSTGSMIRHGRALTVDAEGKTVGWIDYSDGKIVSTGPDDPREEKIYP